MVESLEFVETLTLNLKFLTFYFAVGFTITEELETLVID